MPDLLHLKEQFDDQGYVVVEDVLSPDVIAALETDYSQLLDKHVPRWLADGHIPDAFADLPLHQRAGQIISHLNSEEFRWFDIAFPQAKKPMGQLPNFSAAVFDLLVNPSLLDCIEVLIGDASVLRIHRPIDGRMRTDVQVVLCAARDELAREAGCRRVVYGRDCHAGKTGLRMSLPFLCQPPSQGR